MQAAQNHLCQQDVYSVGEFAQCSFCSKSWQMLYQAMKKSNARVREAQSFCWELMLAITGSQGVEGGMFSNGYLEMLS